MAPARASVGLRGIPARCNAQYVTYAVRLRVPRWPSTLREQCQRLYCQGGQGKLCACRGSLTVLSVSSWDNLGAANRNRV